MKLDVFINVNWVDQAVSSDSSLLGSSQSKRYGRFSRSL